MPYQILIPTACLSHKVYSHACHCALFCTSHMYKVSHHHQSSNKFLTLVRFCMLRICYNIDACLYSYCLETAVKALHLMCTAFCKEFEACREVRFSQLNKMLWTSGIHALIPHICAVFASEKEPLCILESMSHAEQQSDVKC